MADFNAEHQRVLDELMLAYDQVRPGKMFGFPAYYAGRKMCVCLYEDGVGIKLAAESVARLLESDPNAKPFQPMGKARMREWVQIDLPDSNEYRQYASVFEESIRFLLAQQGVQDVGPG